MFFGIQRLRSKLRIFAAAILVWFFIFSGTLAASERLPWLAYYSTDIQGRDFSAYRLLVFDSEYHPPLYPFQKRDSTVLGYLSLGEMENFRPYFSDVQKQGLLVSKNPNWKDSYYVDIRDPRWAARMIEDIIPRILEQGFDGILMDTLDSALFLETQNPKKYGGMKKAATQLVRSIRLHYPNISLAMNRAYPILPEVEHLLDYELAESVYGDYDFINQTYSPTPGAQAKRQVEMLQRAQARRPGLTILTLDYWNPSDHRGIQRLYDKQRANGFQAYVGTINLDQIVLRGSTETHSSQPDGILSRLFHILSMND